MKTKEKPASEYCYEIPTSGDPKICPDLDDTIALQPKCLKFGKGLSWDVSGHILKCEECT